jgi:hypothetical protein
VGEREQGELVRLKNVKKLWRDAIGYTESKMIS